MASQSTPSTDSPTLNKLATRSAATTTFTSEVCSYSAAQLGKAYQVAGVLFDVLCSVNKTEKAGEVPADIIESAKDIEAKQYEMVKTNELVETDKAVEK
nr:callose synthase 5-like [Tanacetum cinerariifolium]